MARKRNSKTTEATANQVVETTNDEIDDADLAAIEAALNGDGDVTITINDDDYADVDDVTLDADIAADEAKSKAYADQKGSDILTEEEVKAAAESKSTEKKASKGTVIGGAAAEVDTFVKAAMQILGGNVVLDTDEGELTDEQLAQALKEVTQKKVREKALNLLNHIMNGAKLANYTEFAVALLVKSHQNGGTPVTLSEIKKVYEEKGYKAGTVSAQSGQMMALFPALGIAKRGQRGVLEPNPNSVLLDALAS